MVVIGEQARIIWKGRIEFMGGVFGAQDKRVGCVQIFGLCDFFYIGFVPCVLFGTVFRGEAVPFWCAGEALKPDFFALQVVYGLFVQRGAGPAHIDDERAVLRF